MKIKVQYGTINSDNACRALIFSYAGCAAVIISWFMVHPSSNCTEPTVPSRISNLTSTPSDKPYCYLSFEKCLCSNLSNKINSSYNCVTDVELECSHMLTLLSFVLQICLIRELFTLNADYKCKLLRIIWTILFYTFVGLVIAIYSNNCYHNYITLFFYITCLLLLFFQVHDLNDGKRRVRVSFNHPIYTYTNPIRINGNSIKPWQELP